MSGPKALSTERMHNFMISALSEHQYVNPIYGDALGI
jgi:hypothetical protein